MPQKACKTATFGIHKAGQKSTSIIKRWVLIILWRFCERTCKGVYFCYFIGRQPGNEEILSRAVHGVSLSFPGIFHLLSHSIFLIWPHFYDKSSEKYIRLIFLLHFSSNIIFSDKILYFVPLFSNCALYFSHSCTIAFFAYSVVSPSWFEKTMSKWYKLL